MRQQARAAGREQRHAGRTSTDPLRGDAERVIEWFRSELRRVARPGTRTAEDVAALRDLLQRTLDEAREILTRPRA